LPGRRIAEPNLSRRSGVGRFACIPLVEPLACIEIGCCSAPAELTFDKYLEGGDCFKLETADTPQ